MWKAVQRRSLLVVVAGLVASCGGKEEVEPRVEKPAPAAGGIELDALTDFVGASRVKAVWVKQQKDGGLDQHAAGKSHKIMALDTAGGGAERELVGKVGSYSRPLFTPDGERVVFSTKAGEKDARGVRSYRPKCFVVNFDGSGLKELGKGYAECVWRDPADGRLWVYVGVDFKDSDTVVMEGARLERFPLDDPTKRELVWDKTPVGAEGFSLSRDGERCFKRQLVKPEH